MRRVLNILIVRLDQSGIQYESYTLSISDNTFDGGLSNIYLINGGIDQNFSWGSSGSTIVYERDRIEFGFRLENSSTSYSLNYTIYLNNNTWRSGNIPKSSGSLRQYQDFVYEDVSVQSDLIFRVEQK